MAAAMSCAQAEAAEQSRHNRELLRELMAAHELLEQHSIPLGMEPVPDSMTTSGRLAHDAAVRRPTSAGASTGALRNVPAGLHRCLGFTLQWTRAVLVALCSETLHVCYMSVSFQAELSKKLPSSYTTSGLQ